MGTSDEIRGLERIEKMIADGLDRLERAVSLPDPEYVSILRAAEITSLSYSHIRRAILADDLPAANVGSPAHPIYRIARTDLIAWMERKKGGSNDPPKSQVRGLIDRYFGRSSRS
jgi:hypothetical protein